MLDLRKLNKEQKRAVTWERGPVIVVAGPGTGKTAVITSRIAYLLRKGIKPEEILALTFTDKAAGEMEERVEKITPSSFYYDFWISTFHSFCEKVLRNHALDIGISPDFKIIEETSSWILLKQNIDDFGFNYYRPLNNPAKFASAIINFFTRLKDETITTKKFYSFSLKQKDQKIKELAIGYEKYQKLLLKNNFLDFNDLINYTIELFEKRPQILKEYEKKFKYLLVDEFQDTNYAQYKLIKLLSSPLNNILVCCDPNQAIYYWRGASSKNIVEFQKDFPRFKKVFLVKNYRSFQNLLDMSFKVSLSLGSKNLKNSQKLKAAKKGRGNIDHFHFKTIEHEIKGIFDKILEIKEKENGSFKDFAVLTRTNNSANLIARYSERVGIPYHFVALKGLYQRSVIVDIISYFKLLDNYHESSAVYRVLNFPCWKIPSREIIKIIQHSRRFFSSTWEVIEKPSLIEGISQQTIKKIDFIVGLTEKHSVLSSRRSVSEVFISFLNDSGYLSFLARNGNKEDFEYIDQFFDRIKRFENSSIDPFLKNFVKEIDLELESGESGKHKIESDIESDAVRISTIHTAKGLEFKHVFVANMVDKRFPLDERKSLIEVPEKLIKENASQKNHLDEEIRLFYVAVTRAMESLFLTSADNYGGVRRKKISRFLIDLGYCSSESEENEKKEIEEKKIRTKPEKHASSLPKYFSFTQLAAFLNCPLQYEFAHVLKLPVQGKPSLVFGKTIHNTFHDSISESLKRKISLHDLNIFYDKNWINEWYQTKRQRDEYYRLGKKILKNYYQSCQWPPKVAIINGKPALETQFVLDLKGNLIKGKIDRIDVCNGGIEIIDYKTGSGKENLKEREKYQLLIYQIVAEENLNLKPVKLSYHYLIENKKKSFLGTNKEKNDVKQKILKTIKKILNNEFSPNPGWHCRYCDFKNICDYSERG